MGLMTPEVVEDSLVEAEEPRRLDGEDLRVGGPRGGDSGSEGSVFDP